MTNTLQAIRVGIFFALGVALVWVVHQTIDQQSILSVEKGYTLYTPFKNLRQLKAGDEVRLAGVRVGHVIRTDLRGMRAVATLKIDENVKIPVDSVATITTAGLLGNDYIYITMGDNVLNLENGASLATKATEDINTVLSNLGGGEGGIGGLLGDLGDSDGLFKNLNDLIVENKETIKSALQDFRSIMNKINTPGDSSLSKLVNEDDVYQEFIDAAKNVQAASNQITSLAKNAQSIVDKINDGEGLFGTLLYDDKVDEQIKVAINNIVEFSKKLNNDNSTLGRLMTDDSLYKQAKDVVNKLDGAVDSITNSGPVSAVGIAATALF